MDTKVGIKEEDILSDELASQGEREFFTKVRVKKEKSDSICDVAAKNESKSQTFSSEFCPQKERLCFAKHCETVTCSNSSVLINKTELGSEEEAKFLPENPTMVAKKYNNDHEVVDKIEIKEEPWWLETQSSSVCDDIKDEDFTPVKSPSLKTIRTSNTYKMDTKVGVKEEDILSDELASQSEKEFFTKVRVKKEKSDSICDVAAKTESKSEKSSSEFCPKKERECFAKHCETVTCSNSSVLSTKTELGSEEETTFLPENPTMMVKKYNNDHEVVNKIEIKEEPWWLETQSSSVCDDIKDDFTPVKSPRLCAEVGSTGSSLPPAERSRRNTSLNYDNVNPGCEGQESDGTRVEKSSKHSAVNEINSRVQKSNKAYKCSICDKNFTRLLGLKRHKSVHDGKKPYKCETCEKRFTQLCSMRRHSLIHEGKRPHKCEICEKRFICLPSLNMHKLIHEAKKLHKCEICEKRFTYSTNLSMHRLIHEGKKPHKCEICEKSFSRLGSLKYHVSLHESKKLHNCETCGKKFFHLSELKLHNWIHKGKKPHYCEICDKNFTHLYQLNKHNLMHEGRQPHKCKYCERKFTLLANLKVHQLKHEGKRPHKCEICKRSFTQLTHLKRHNLIHQDKTVPQI